MMFLDIGLLSVTLTRTHTHISRDVNDAEILAFTRGLNDASEPEGTYLFRTFRTNQLLSKQMPGAQQMGIPWEAFNPNTYLEQRAQCREMHMS